jgi:hypothetical protein
LLFKLLWLEHLGGALSLHLSHQFEGVCLVHTCAILVSLACVRCTAVCWGRAVLVPCWVRAMLPHVLGPSWVALHMWSKLCCLCVGLELCCLACRVTRVQASRQRWQSGGRCKRPSGEGCCTINNSALGEEVAGGHGGEWEAHFDSK